MVDFKVNDNGVFQMNQYGNFDSVDKINEFIQTVHLRLSNKIQRSIIGEQDSEIIRQLIQVKVQDVVNEYSKLDGVLNTEVSQSENKSNTYLVSIKYNSEWITNFELSV
jgi:hypothetical protein